MQFINIMQPYNRGPHQKQTTTTFFFLQIYQNY